MKRILTGTTYANVTATLALVVAIGGASYAAVNLPKDSVGTKQIKKNAVKSKKVKDDSLTGKDINESALAKVPSAAAADSATTATTATTATNADTAANAVKFAGRSLRGLSQWAFVADDGGPISSSGPINVSKLGPSGRYRVDFPADVSGCGFNANVTSATPIADGTTLTSAFALVARSTASANSVMVQTRSDSGALTNQAFVVTVQC